MDETFWVFDFKNLKFDSKIENVCVMNRTDPQLLSCQRLTFSNFSGCSCRLPHHAEKDCQAGREWHSCQRYKRTSCGSTSIWCGSRSGSCLPKWWYTIDVCMCDSVILTGQKKMKNLGYLTVHIYMLGVCIWAVPCASLLHHKKMMKSLGCGGWDTQGGGVGEIYNNNKNWT